MFANPVWNDLNPTTIAGVEMSYDVWMFCEWKIF